MLSTYNYYDIIQLYTGRARPKSKRNGDSEGTCSTEKSAKRRKSTAPVTRVRIATYMSKHK